MNEESGRALREPALLASLPEPASGLGPSGDDPARMAVPSLGFQQHDVGDPGWDYNKCNRCGWVNPDTQHKRGTAATWAEWFPSMDAFEHFKRTGVRAWLGGSLCDQRVRDSGSDPQGGDAKQAPGEASQSGPKGIAQPPPANKKG